MESWRIAPGSWIFFWEKIGIWIFSAHELSCCIAAARKVSQAATATEVFWDFKRYANLAMEVVLPVPLAPRARKTKRGLEGWNRGGGFGIISTRS